MDRLIVAVRNPHTAWEEIPAPVQSWYRLATQEQQGNFATWAQYINHRADVRRELFKTDWLPQTGSLSAQLIATTPVGLLTDLFPEILTHGPQAGTWVAWNRQLTTVFKGLNKAAGHERQNFVNSFIDMYGSRVRQIDEEAERLVFDHYRDIDDTVYNEAKARFQDTDFMRRTLPQMRPDTWQRFANAHRCGSELILLGDLLQQHNKRWERSLRAHRGFMRKALAQAKR